jgi:hypothetical protein
MFAVFLLAFTLFRQPIHSRELRAVDQLRPNKLAG